MCVVGKDRCRKGARWWMRCGMVIFKVVVSPGAVMLLGWVVYSIACIIVLLHNVGSVRVGLPSVVLWTSA